MAGGMTSGRRETLAQRVATTRARQAGSVPAGPGSVPESVPAATPPVAVPEVRHCWYDGAHGRQAALLLEWRNVEGHYDGRIAVAAHEPGQGWGIVEMWVDAAMLSPV